MASGKITNKNTLSGAISSGNNLKTAAIAGGSGTTDHSRLINRSEPDQHPIEAITDLRTELDSKLNSTTALPLIDEALQTKAKGLYYDAKCELARKPYWYLTAEIDSATKMGTKESVISGPYDLGMGGGSGGGGGVTAVSVKQVNWPVATAVGNANVATKIMIDWSSTIGEDKSPTGDGTLYLSVNGRQVETCPKQAQGLVEFDISKYIIAGDNTVQVKVLDMYGTTGVTVGVVTGVSLELKSAFNQEAAYYGAVDFTYTPIGNVDKRVYFIIDGDEENAKTQIVRSSNELQTYTITGLTHGAHTLKVYFEAIINGQLIPSNSLFYDIIFVEENNTTPIIASEFNNFTQEQYINFNIPYRVYVYGREEAVVTLKVNDKEVRSSKVSTNGTHTWAYRADTATVHLNDKNEIVRDTPPLHLEIVCGTTRKYFDVDIVESKITVTPILNNLELALSANGRSNQEFEENRQTWESNGYNCTFSNFNWSSDGWLPDKLDSEGKPTADSTTILRVGGAAQVEIPIKVFSTNFTAQGKTIELEFSTHSIRDYSTPIISCLDSEKTPFYTVEPVYVNEENRKYGFNVVYDYHVLSEMLEAEGTYTFNRINGSWFLKKPNIDELFSADINDYGLKLNKDLDGSDLEPPVLNPESADTSEIIDGDKIAVTFSMASRGFKITPQVASIRSQQSFLSTQYKEDEHVRVSFVVEPNNKDHNRIIWMYINGVASGAMQYPVSDTFEFNKESSGYITIGSPEATVDIYNIRVYNTALPNRQIVNNWIADTADTVLKTSRFNHNQILNEADELTPESLIYGAPDLPYIIWGMEKLPESKDDDVFNTNTSARYVDTTDPSRNFTAIDCEYKIQGTSSAVYPTKNIRLRTKKSRCGPNYAWYDDDNNDLKDKKFPITYPGGLGVDYFTFKVDYASSEGANNVELTKLYNDASKKYGLLTPPQQQNDQIRVGIDGFPVAAFYMNTTKDSDNISFLTKANFNNDKGNEDVYGFADGDESWETTNNSAEAAKYLKPVTVDNFDEGFEIRFPDKDGYNNMSKLGPMTAWVYSTYRDPNRTAVKLDPAVVIPYTDVVINKPDQENISFTYDFDGEGDSAKIISVTFTQDTDDYRLSKFKHELKDLFNVDSCLFYYLYTELFLMIDSRAKNAFPTYFATRTNTLVKDDDGNDIPNTYTDGGNRWYWLPYDMDTAIGIDNKGKLSFDYYLEDIDTMEGGANVYNGQDSVMWCNIRDAFKSELASMYSTLRSQGLISYDEVDKRFEDHQRKWPEVLLNKDSYNKYIVPLQNGDNYLEMLQGTKEQQRKWWLYNRFKYIDSKYNAGDAKADFIQFRAYVGRKQVKPDLTITPYANIYATASFGNSNKYLISERIKNRAEAVILRNPFTLMDDENDQETYIYSASQLKSIGDISGFHPDTVKIGKAIRLQDLKVGDASPSYKNPYLKELTVGSNTLLKTIDARNCVNLGTGTTTAPDLSKCTNIEEIYFTGTKIKGIDLPVGGTIRKLHLPGTLKSLIIRNQPLLEDLYIESTNTTITRTTTQENGYTFTGLVVKKDRWDETNANANIYLADSLDATSPRIRVSITTKSSEIEGTFCYDNLIEGESKVTVNCKYIDVRYDFYENAEEPVQLAEYATRSLNSTVLTAVETTVDSLITTVAKQISKPTVEEFKTSLIEQLWLEGIPSSAIKAKDFIQNMKPDTQVSLIGINETYTSVDEVKYFYDLLDRHRGIDKDGSGKIPVKPQVTGIINIDRISYRDYIELASRYPEVTINAKQIWCSVNFYTKTADQGNDRKEILYASISTPVDTELNAAKELIIKGKKIHAPLNPDSYKSVAKVYTFANWRLQEASYNTAHGWKDLQMPSEDEELKLPIWTEEILIASDTRIDAYYTGQPRKYSVTFETGSNIIELAEGFTKILQVNYDTVIPQEPSLIWKTDPDTTDDQKLPPEIVFEGWFTADGTRWDFVRDTVKHDMVLTASWADPEEPSVRLSRKTYNIFTCDASDNLGIVKWAVVKDSPEEPTVWEPIEATTELLLDYSINSAGKYYFWIADSNGNKAFDTITAYNINVTTTVGITDEHYYFIEKIQDGDLITENRFKSNFALEETVLSITATPAEHYDNLSIDIPFEVTIDAATFKVSQDVTISLACKPINYTVTFITGKEVEGIKVTAQKVTYNTLVTNPLALYHQGYIINNWYRDPELTQLWNFDTQVIEGDTILYAEWLEYRTPTRIKVKIPHNFDEWEDRPATSDANYESIRDSYNPYRVCINYSQNRANSVKVTFGDGSEEFSTEATGHTTIEHIYTEPGEYIIEIYGTAYGYRLGEGYSTQTVDPGCCVTDIEFAWDITTTAPFAFKGAQIEELNLTPYMTTIATGAFAVCRKLKTLKIPKSIQIIEAQAFENCEGLTGNVTIPKTVSTLGSSAFRHCHSLNQLIFEENGQLTFIEAYLANDSGITYLRIPGHITKIGDGAFGNCNKLQKVVLMNPNLAMGANVFANIVTNLSVAGPIDWSLGAGNNDKYNIEYAWVERIPENAFSSPTNPLIIQSALKSIILPEGVKEIGDNAFQGTFRLTSISLPNSLETIGARAFYSTGLTKLIVPNSVSNIGACAFGFNSNLADSAVTLYCSSSTTLVAYPQDGWFFGCASTLKPKIPAHLIEWQGPDENIVQNLWIQYYGPHWNAYAYNQDTGFIGTLEFEGINKETE